MVNTLGTRIAFYRKKKGLSEEELGSILSVSPDLVRDWEKDTRIPSKECQEKLATLFAALGGTCEVSPQTVGIEWGDGRHQFGDGLQAGVEGLVGARCYH